MRQCEATSEQLKTLSVSTSAQRPSGISPDGSRAVQASDVATTARDVVCKCSATPSSPNLSAAVQRCHCACRPALVALLSTHLSARVATFRRDSCRRSSKMLASAEIAARQSRKQSEQSALHTFDACFTLCDSLQQAQPQQTLGARRRAFARTAPGHATDEAYKIV